MAKQLITVDDKAGITSVETIVKSVSDGIAAGQLTEKTALALRLLHDAVKSEPVEEGISISEPVSFFDSAFGTFMFRCACGRRFYGSWDSARYEAIGHVELRHSDKALRKDLSKLEDVIEALIVPNPLNSWEQLQFGYWESLPTVKDPEKG